MASWGEFTMGCEVDVKAQVSSTAGIAVRSSNRVISSQYRGFVLCDCLRANGAIHVRGADNLGLNLGFGVKSQDHEW